MFACSTLILVVLQLQGASGQNALSPSLAQAPVQQSVSSAQQRTSPDSGADPPPPPQASEQERFPSAEAPIPATNGTPGIFTVQSAEALPKGVVTTSAYTNKFGLAPGSVTVLSLGFNIAGGITNKLTAFAQWEPYRYANIGEPSQLSLRQAPGCPHDVFKAPIFCGVNDGPETPNSWHGPAAAYVPGFPFAAYNTSDLGPVTVGAKYNFYSETRGDPLSVSLGGALVIPTESAASELAKHGLQAGALNYSFTLALSRTLGRQLLLANNVTYVVTRNPKIGNETLYTPGDQMIFGQGFIFRPESKLQFLTEYTLVLGQEGHGFGLIGIDTENTSLGPSNPVDGVWGARWYFADTAALDVGYRYMLNLHQLHDRSGFTIKVSKVFGWHK